MTASLIITIAIIVLFTVLTICITWKKQKRITCMTGMMIAMTTGMLTGLLVGVIFGILLNDNIFLSTILSMGLGLIIGFFAGLPISLMAVLDGMMSGLMGGMMGAMLGVMVSSEYWDIMIKVMFVIFTGFMLTLFYLIQDETVRKGEEYFIKFLRNPIFLMVTMLLFFYIYTLLGPTVYPEQVNPHIHQ